jgi:hypothetical protein
MRKVNTNDIAGLLQTFFLARTRGRMTLKQLGELAGERRAKYWRS